jgi:hypothetical protein
VRHGQLLSALIASAIGSSFGGCGGQGERRRLRRHHGREFGLRGRRQLRGREQLVRRFVERFLRLRRFALDRRFRLGGHRVCVDPGGK